MILLLSVIPLCKPIFYGRKVLGLSKLKLTIMIPKPISENLFFWLQIVEGLETDEILELAASEKIAVLEEACTAIASVLAKRCPSPSDSSRLN